jgi:thiamine biosynthesis protein ThiI
MDSILVRYGEIGLKGRNRGEFIKKLRSNIKECLKKEGISGRVERIGVRLYVRTEQTEEALSALRRVFGIVSLSPVTHVRADMDEIKSEALRAAREGGLTQGKSFRVRSRRVDKTFPLISPQIAASAGGFIKESTGSAVDLSGNADVTVEVEILEGEALVYSKRIGGLGGLPLGSQGRAVALISGGIDSPVAAWMMMKRGCSVIPVHFSQSEEESQKMLDNCAVLSRYAFGWELRPIVESHHQLLSATLQRLQEAGDERWACIFCKRSIVRRAAEIAREVGALAIVMGDSLGQVASQTLENIEVVSQGVTVPILRPLIGMDKTEIIGLAKEIGTFEVSTRESRPCPYLPHNPITQANRAKFQEVLARLGDEAC